MIRANYPERSNEVSDVIIHLSHRKHISCFASDQSAPTTGNDTTSEIGYHEWKFRSF